MKKTWLLCLGWGLALAAAAGSSTAAPIARVIVVETSNLPAYLHEVETLRAQFRKAGLPVTLRIWRARYAGSQTGTIIGTIEVPDLATLAKVEAARKSNPDIGATMERVEKLRKLTSDSIYEEL